MIYLDHAATSLQRPSAVAQAMGAALAQSGNAGRSFYGPAMAGAHIVYEARRQAAALAGLPDPLQVAFTSGATESLNLVLDSLLSPGDEVVTTVLEHNSVLRPLYRLGCTLRLLDCDDAGRLKTETLSSLITPRTRAVVCTHGSNLLGSITDIAALHSVCHAHGIPLIVDAAQTFGSIPLKALDADIWCFAGHKSLMGPQGTGGILAPRPLPWRLTKTGGTGTDSFATHQPLVMPDVYEAGTANLPGLAGLAAGIAFVQQTGPKAIEAHHRALTEQFLAGLAQIPGIRMYGPPAGGPRLPVVALNVGERPAGEVSTALWENHEIATRPGAHCAPLAHRRFGTEQRGMVRFSFGFFTTSAEIDAALAALHTLAKG